VKLVAQKHTAYGEDAGMSGATKFAAILRPSSGRFKTISGATEVTASLKV